MRILFFGMTGTFSLPPFESLVQSGHEVTAVIIPADRRSQTDAVVQHKPMPSPSDVLEIPLIADQSAPTIAERAWEAGIPVYKVSRPAAKEFLDLVRQWQVDLACVACFNRILPADLLTLPTHGFLNLHPSLLPSYRGPDPIFWQLRDGIEEIGVTVHWMDAGLDTGDIALQTTVPLEDGLAWGQIEHRCAEAGARLLLDVCTRIEAGDVLRVPQVGGSYYPSPRGEDFTIPVAWTARRAFNFIRGTQAWGLPYTVQVDGMVVRLSGAIAWTDDLVEPGKIESQGGFVLIGMGEGVLVAQES